MSLLSIVTYPNIASAQGSFTFSFSYINGTDIDAFVDGVKVFENNASTGTAVGGNTYTVTFSSPGSNTLTFTPNVPAGSDVRIERNTDLTTKEVDFSDGSVLTENALDKAVDQVFFAAQEAIDKTASTITEAPDGKWDAQNKIIKNVADPVNNTDAVNKQFISTNLPNINTVAGISTDVTTVAGISSDVTAVAADATDIGTVSTNIASVNTVATNIADVVTVANDLNEAISEIETAADDLNEAVSDIDTVSTNIANVNTVGGDITNVNTVAGSISNVNTVAGNNANVTTVAGISGDVTTVASNNANVTAVAGNATNINTVAANNANVTTVAGISANVTTVANDTTDIGTVASNIADVNTVAANNANITAVAADATDIGTVASNIANVNAVGTDIANVNTVATNIADVNNFADTYFVSATAPASPTTGDLWFDTTSNTMKVYGSSGFQNAGSSVNGTAQRLTYTATANQTTFAATYDAGYVDVYLNGVKLIAGTDFTATNGTSVVLASGAAVGDTVDIVAYGTFQLSNFSINDANDVNAGGATSGQFLKYDGTNWVGDTVSTPTLTSLGLDNHDDITVDSSGKVGIGDATPDDTLSVYGGTQRLRVGNSDTNHVRIGRNSTSGNFEMTRTTSGATDQVFFKAAEANNGNVILQEGGGNVGVGTSSPENFSGYSNLEVYNSSSGGVVQFTGGGTEASPAVKGRLVADSGSGLVQIKSVTTTPIGIYTGNVERARFSAGGMYFQGTTNSDLYATGTDTGITLQGSSQRQAGNGTAIQISSNGAEGWANFYVNRLNIGSDNRFFQFSSNGSTVGQITGTTSSTSYNTSSDYRLKENDVAMTGAIERVKQLQPKRFNFIADADTTVDGFMAHEVQTIVPEAITGTHNQVDDDGNPVYQGIDQSKLVPLLTGALQEAIAKIETLETEMTALKARVTELETT